MIDRANSGAQLLALLKAAQEPKQPGPPGMPNPAKELETMTTCNCLCFFTFAENKTILLIISTDFILHSDLAFSYVFLKFSGRSLISTN